MDTAKIFEKGKNQSILLPDSYRIKSKEVFIIKIGDALIMLPKKKGWKSFTESLYKFTEDFLSNREQPSL